MSSSDATMSSPIFVPDALKFYVNRLSFSKNRVRLQTLSSVAAGPSSQIIVRLPSNTMVNLASLTMTGSVRATVTSAGTDEAVALPTNFDFSFIETLSLIANGGIITQPFTNYKLLGNMLNDIYGSQDKILSRSGLQGSLPSPLIAAATTAPPQSSQYVPFAINNWISATQTMAPSYISTNLLGDLELRLTMADTSILATGNKGTGENITGLQAKATWDMKDLNFYIETASVQSNMLEQAIAAKLAAGEPINVPFENVFSFSQTNTSASFNQRFSVSSQSVNKILATVQRDSDFKPTANRKLVNGIPSAFLRHSNGAQVAQFSVNNQYSPNYQIDSELNDAYNPITPVTDANRRDMRISNALVETRAAMDIPDYDYDQADMLCQPTQMPFQFLGGGMYKTSGTSTSVADAKYIQPPSKQIITPGTTTNGQTAIGVKSSATYWFPYEDQQPIRHFLDNKFMLATSFDLDVCDKDRLVSGINTLGSNAQMFLNVVGDGGGNSQSTVYVLCTSMVQIYQGATLKIIQ